MIRTKYNDFVQIRREIKMLNTLELYLLVPYTSLKRQKRMHLKKKKATEAEKLS